MVDLTTLEAERRRVQKRLDQARAPRRQEEAAAAELEALDDQIAAAAAAAEAEHRAQQQRENEIADLQRQWAQLQRPWEYPAKGEMVERYLWHVERVYRRLGVLDVTVEPFTIDPLEAVKPLVEALEREQTAMREIFMRDRATPEQAEAERRRHDLTGQMMSAGRDQETAEQIASLVADDGIELDEAIRRVDNADTEEETDESI